MAPIFRETRAAAVSYESEYRRSIDDPEAFWKEKAGRIAWHKFPETILAKDANGNDAWFADGELNTAWPGPFPNARP